VNAERGIASREASRASAEDAELAEVLDECLEALEAGRPLDGEALAAAHPAIAERLRACLASLQVVERATGELASTAPEEWRPNEVECLGDFQLLREVGRGGMGVVYEAEQRSLRRRVAVKVLPFAAALDARQLQRFKNESLAAAQLHHTHIVPVYYVGCERGVHFYAMQFVEGQSLAAVIAERRELAGGEGQPAARPLSAVTVDQAEGRVVAAVETPRMAGVLSTVRSTKDATWFRTVARLGVEAAEALDYAHQQGIVHRDIKPANLLVDGSDHLWVTDFGLARVQTDTRVTLTGDLVGTLRYMSPEQALAKRVVVDHRTDVYSLGATLYELLTLEPVFDGGDRQELLRQIAFEEPLPPQRLNRAIPAELETIILKALEKYPVERYATAQELAEDLRRFLQDEPITARRPTLGKQLARWSRRHQVVIASLAAGLLVGVAVLAGSVGWVLRDQEARRAETQRLVTAALADEETLRHQHRYPEALVAAQRAEELLVGGEGKDELRQVVAERLADEHMLAKLEDIRSRILSAWVQADFNYAQADREFTQAFRGYGIDVKALSPDEAGRQIGARAIRVELAAALDLWARALQKVGGGKDSGWTQLLAAARVADDDPERTRLRQVVEREDREALIRLASSIVVKDLPVPTVQALGRALIDAGAFTQAEAVLRAARREHPADFWINRLLASVSYQMRPPRFDEAIRFYTAAVAIRPLNTAVLNDLGLALAGQGRREEAIAEYQKALDLDPEFNPAHVNLGATHLKQGRLDDAMAEFREAIRIVPTDAAAHNNLGIALRSQGRLDDAMAEFRKAVELDPSSAKAHTNLGATLRARGRLDDAMAEFREAVGLDPNYAEAQTNLGVGLRDQGRLDDALTQFRKAIALDPNLAKAHMNLGATLLMKDQVDDALTELREAVRLDPKDLDVRNTLGSVLHGQRQLDDALAELNEVLRLDPKHAGAHFNRGNILRDQQKPTEAVAAFQQAIKYKPDFAEAHCNLGLMFARQGRFAEALAEFKLGHELGTQQPGWSYPSELWLRTAEQFAGREAKLEQVLSGQAKPANAAECLELAKLCQQYKQLHTAAFRFYEEAFAAQPGLADDMQKQSRYDAARAAALAGCGHGKDAGNLSEEERTRLRRQALTWLRDDLKAYGQQLDKQPDKARPLVAQRMQHWQDDTDFAGVRGPEALVRLPEAERQEWQKLWEDVAALRQRAAEPPKPENSGRP
jgi:tetratricopeptide (TPR) repeat protein